MLTDRFVRVVGHDLVMQGLAGGAVIAAMNAHEVALVAVWSDPSERGVERALGVVVMPSLDVVSTG